MTAPLVSLLFLTSLWLMVKLALDFIAEDGPRIAAALRGRSLITQPTKVTRPISVRFQPRAGSVRRPIRVTPEWRAAA
jgi:hypothetical protein